MATRITGLVTNPDGSLLDGHVTLTPLAWHADTAPDRLVSTQAAVAVVTDGVVDVSIDTDGQLAWRLTVTSGAGLVTRLQGVVVPPASGEVRIDQLAPAPSTDVAVAPNPGPPGPPGDTVDLGPLTSRVAAVEDRNTAQDDSIADIISESTTAFTSVNGRLDALESAPSDLPPIDAGTKPGEVLAVDDAGTPGWTGSVNQLNDSLGDLSGLHVYGGMDGFISDTEGKFGSILGHAPPTVEATLQVDKYATSFVRVMGDALLTDGAEHWVQFAVATTPGTNGEVFPNADAVSKMSGNAWYDNNGSLGNVNGANGQGVSNLTLSNYILRRRTCRVKFDGTTDPSHPKLIVLEAVPSDPAQTVLQLDSLADVSVSGADTPNNGDVLTLTANGWKGRPAEQVTGPASATDNALVRFDGTTGKLVQDSGATIADDGTLALGAPVQVTIPGATAATVQAQFGPAQIRAGDYGNQAMGNEALFSRTTGNYNTAFGNWSLRHATTGGFNTALGGISQLGVMTGGQNVAVGYNAQTVFNVLNTSDSLTFTPDPKYLYSVSGTNLQGITPNVGTNYWLPPNANPVTVTATANLWVAKSAYPIDVNQTACVGHRAHTTGSVAVALGADASAGAKTVQMLANTTTGVKVYAGVDRLFSLTELKAVVAASADFADFKTKIAALT